MNESPGRLIVRPLEYWRALEWSAGWNFLAASVLLLGSMLRPELAIRTLFPYLGAVLAFVGVVKIRRLSHLRNWPVTAGNVSHFQKSCIAGMISTHFVYSVRGADFEGHLLFRYLKLLPPFPEGPRVSALEPGVEVVVVFDPKRPEKSELWGLRGLPHARESGPDRIAWP